MKIPIPTAEQKLAVVGVTGSGKTYLVRETVAHARAIGHPVVVISPYREMPVREWLSPKDFATVDLHKEALAIGVTHSLESDDARRMVLAAQYRLEARARHYDPELDGKHPIPPLLLVIDEASLSRKELDAWRIIGTQSRHWNVGVIAMSQYYIGLTPEYRRQSRNQWIGTQLELEDCEAIAKKFSPRDLGERRALLAEIPSLKVGEFVEYNQGRLTRHKKGS